MAWDEVLRRRRQLRRRVASVLTTALCRRVTPRLYPCFAKAHGGGSCFWIFTVTIILAYVTDARMHRNKIP